MVEEWHLTSQVKAAKNAIQSIGMGFDITEDLRLKHCKDSSDPCLIELEDGQGRDIVLPGGISISNVSKSIKCDKGERMRFKSDVLSFQQMSEQFNQEMSLTGKVPSGLFNTMFEFSNCWQKDAAKTKTLAYDGWFITLYTIALAKSQMPLHDRVKQAVPSSWDPAALARPMEKRLKGFFLIHNTMKALRVVSTQRSGKCFIERYGTHVIVGVKMGGKDVVYVKQQYSSNHQPAEIQRRLKEMADRRFLDVNRQYGVDLEEKHKDKSDVREIKLRFAESCPTRSYSDKEDVIGIYKRRGGSNDKNLSHSEWLNSIQSEPDAISMSFVPITSLLNRVPGSGFLNHAINLYLRFKPPIEELRQFFEFQLPRQWAPMFCELALGPQRKQQSSSSLQFSLMGPRLFVNTSPVHVGQRPVTGLRLHLEGARSNHLAIHLQHLCSLPKIFQLDANPIANSPRMSDRKYYEPVQWKNFSHVCTAPIESYEDSIVTGAELQVGNYSLKKILFLHLYFSRVCNAMVVRQAEWHESQHLAQKSGIVSMLMSGHFMTVQKPPLRPDDVNFNSAVYPQGPPVPVLASKLLRIVDTTEMTRGPQDAPGYWVVSGARLLVKQGKISLKVRYSLLTVTLPDDV